MDNDIEYVDILTGKICRQFMLITCINWSVRSSSRRGGDGVNWMDMLRYFSQLRVSLYYST